MAGVSPDHAAARGCTQVIVISRTLPRWKASLGFNIIATGGDPRTMDRMLRSVDAISDQIVIVCDHKAHPALFQVAGRYTDDVFFYRWEKDFALARNRALARTHTDYVAWIDKDEWYRPSVAARIHNLMSRPMGKAYYVWQVSPTNTGDVLFVPQVRIFPRVPGVRWEIPIHEQILPSIDRLGVKTQLTDLRVEHAGYLNPEVVASKNRRNLEILRREVKRNPADSFTRDNYRKALAFQRQTRRAV